MSAMIGITTFIESDEFTKIRRSYANSVATAGGVPVLLSPIVDERLAEELADRLDGLLLSGGGDINPIHYHEEPHPTLDLVCDIRDQYEFQLAKAFMNCKKPILAICRGAQVLNVVLGGTLIQDVPSQVTTDLPHSQEADRHVATHAIQIDPQSKLAEILDECQIDVNSFHHQSVKDLPGTCLATAYAPDGVVEAFEYQGDQFALAVQWHPEAMTHDEHSLKLFRYFVEKCACS
ncbi:putative glutamine amidotransferase [Croceifilum oryzae]|uniref:Glutamine amidotransferase n=1 Tax=Croceifilum oryzae TaxID=1553429 RepID=A0AAJ1WRS6_9BACL|nr:gamma-glutamyl-gamma-aminobutyrate hydrolase family protein [Croceifilum oryzae]MDQ0416308.1 putative glutamine amidotransferase [Croceifilum oryzae]